MPITVAPTSARPRTNSRWLGGNAGSTKMTFTAPILPARSSDPRKAVAAPPRLRACRQPCSSPRSCSRPRSASSTPRHRCQACSSRLVSQDPEENLPLEVRDKLAAHWRIDDGTDAQQIADATRALAGRFGGVDSLIGMLEQLQVPLGEVRDALGIPGMGAAVARNFRDKSRMKDVFAAHGVPCARHGVASSAAEASSIAGALGLPVVVKPPAGAGARSTFRLDSVGQLDAWLRVDPPTPSAPALLEELVSGAEHSFDSVAIDGHVVWHSISSYLPTPLEVLENPWMQWAVLLPRCHRRTGVRRHPRRRGARPARARHGHRLHPHGVVPAHAGAASRCPRWRRGPRARSSPRCSRTRTTPTCTRPGRGSRSSGSSTPRSAATRSAPPTCAARGRVWCAVCTGSTSCSASSASWSSRRGCPGRASRAARATRARATSSCATARPTVVAAALRRVVEVARVEMTG